MAKTTSKLLGGVLGGKMFGTPKVNVAEEQAKLKQQQDAAARAELDKQAELKAAQENANTARMAQEQSARVSFMSGVTEDTDENRRKFLQKV